MTLRLRHINNNDIVSTISSDAEDILADFPIEELMDEPEEISLIQAVQADELADLDTDLEEDDVTNPVVAQSEAEDIDDEVARRVDAGILRDEVAGESDSIFRRGLVSAFAKLCRDYKSNDGFKIGERTVLTFGAVYEKVMDWFRLAHNREDELRDIDRVMHVLDGKPAPDYQQGLVAALRQAMYDFRKNRKTEVTTPYLDPNRVKGLYDTPIKELSSWLRCTKCLRKGRR